MKPPLEVKNVLQPVQRSNLVDSVIAHIREMILNGHFGPGQRLPAETDVARQLRVGRSTVREALRVLSHLGLVESRSGSGTYVASQSNPDLEVKGALALSAINEVYEFRYAIELACAPLAAERRSETQMDAIRKLWSQSRAAAMGNDLTRFAAADTAFHAKIVEASHNGMFLNAYRLAAPLIMEAVTVVLAVGQLSSMRDFHDGLVQAIQDRNSKAAALAVKENFSEAAARLHMLDRTTSDAKTVDKQKKSTRVSRSKKAV